MNHTEHVVKKFRIFHCQGGPLDGNKYKIPCRGVSELEYFYLRLPGDEDHRTAVYRGSYHQKGKFLKYVGEQIPK